MAVHRARNGSVELAYEVIGPPGGEPLLLIMGLDSPMRWWPDGFCLELAERGFTVARFDNRDTGRSTRTRAAAYSAQDLFDDAGAVLDALGWPSAHLVGQSLGASIAIGLGLRYPGRTRTIVSLSGLPRGYGLAEAARHVDPIGLARMARVNARRPRNREQDVRQQVALARMQAARSRPFDEQWATETAERIAADGLGDPATGARQLAAIRAGSRLLRHPERLTVPLLAIHGTEDPLLRPSAAAALARAVPEGRALVLSGMGHEVPHRLWTVLADEITRNADRAHVLSGR